METRQSKNSRQQLTTAELEVLQERFEEQQVLLTRQKEAFASEREKFEQEKKRLHNEKEEEQRRVERELEASHRTITELRNEVRQREDELRKWGSEDQTHNDFETREEMFREVEKLRREMSGLRARNPTPINYGPPEKAHVYDPTMPLYAVSDNSYESMGPKLTFREALETVPYYDGYNMSVSSFSRACRRAREIMPPSSEKNLTRLLINRLRGRAQAAVEDEPCDTIIQLVDLLTSAFGSQKTINQYRGELSIIHIKKGEHILDYVSRVKDLRSAIIDAERRECGQLRGDQLTEIDSLTARSFCEGLPLEYRLQFQASCYNQPSEAFSSAKVIARRLELDKARFEESDRRGRGVERYPVNPIGPPQAHSTPYRSTFTNDRNNHREYYRPETNNYDNRPRRQDYRGNFNKQQEPKGPDYPRDQFYPRERKEYLNQGNPGTSQGRYPVRNYDPARTPLVPDRRAPDSAKYGPPSNADRQDQEPRKYTQHDRREIEKFCRYCKTPGHEIEECRKRQYNNEHSRREAMGNARDPLGWKDAPRGDQIRQTRPVNTIETIPETLSESQS